MVGQRQRRERQRVLSLRFALLGYSLCLARARVIRASHDLTNVIYRGVADKEKGGQGRAPSPYQLLLDKFLNWLNLTLKRQLVTGDGWSAAASRASASSFFAVGDRFAER